MGGTGLREPFVTGPGPTPCPSRDDSSFLQGHLPVWQQDTHLRPTKSKHAKPFGWGLAELPMKVTGLGLGILRSSNPVWQPELLLLQTTTLQKFSLLLGIQLPREATDLQNEDQLGWQAAEYAI